MSLLPEARRRLFTREEVLRMVELNILDEDEPLELINGELIIMTPQGPAHRSLAVIIRDVLAEAYGSAAHIQDHSTLDAGPHATT